MYFHIRFRVNLLMGGEGIVLVGRHDSIDTGVSIVLAHLDFHLQAFHVEDTRDEIVAPTSHTHAHPLTVVQLSRLGRSSRTIETGSIRQITPQGSVLCKGQLADYHGCHDQHFA